MCMHHSLLSREFSEARRRRSDRRRKVQVFDELVTNSTYRLTLSECGVPPGLCNQRGDLLGPGVPFKSILIVPHISDVTHRQNNSNRPVKYSLRAGRPISNSRRDEGICMGVVLSASRAQNFFTGARTLPFARSRRSRCTWSPFFLSFLDLAIQSDHPGVWGTGALWAAAIHTRRLHYTTRKDQRQLQ